MTDREALAALIDVAFLSESDKARILASLPDLPDETIRKLGIVFAKQEHDFEKRLTTALAQIDTFLNSEVQTPDASEE